MKILFVHEVNYLTKPVFEMHEFPEHLASRGHEVGFWHFPEGYSLAEARSLGWCRTIRGRAVPQATLTLYTAPLAGNIAGRLLTALFSHFYARKLIREFRPDIIVSFSVPTQGWQIVQEAKNSGTPLIFRALDVSHKIREGIFSRLVYFSERFVYKNADWVSANNPAMLSYCQSMGASLANSSVDWPPLDLDRFVNGSDGASARKRAGLSSADSVVLYMGSFFYFSGLPQVIEEFARESIREHLVLIGGGEQDAELRKLVMKLGISERVTFTGFIGFDDLPSFLKMATVAINPMLPSLVAQAAIPNKVIQYLACGLSVVSTRLTGLELTFPNSKKLYFENSPEEVVRRAISLCRTEEKNVDSFDDADLKRFSLSESIVGFDKRLGEMVCDE